MRSALPTLLLAACLSLGLATPRMARAARPDGAPDLYRRSYAAEARQDYLEALRLMGQVRAAGVRDYVVELRTGWLLYLNGKYDEAVASYRKAARLEPGAIEPRLGVMLPLMAARRWKRARAEGLAVLKKAPADFTAQSRIAYIYYQQGRYGDAERWYRKSLASFPSNVEMRTGLGWSLLKQQRFRDARAEFQRVLTVAPDHVSAKAGMAQIP